MLDIIPAIDVIDGKCVRLSKGKYETKKIYNEDPLEVAKQFEANGIRRLHMVDLDGAASAHVVNFKVLDRIASKTSLVIDFGGGIKTDEDLNMAYDYGAALFTIGSVAAKQPQLFWNWVQRMGADKFILGADVDHEKIVVNGWKEESQYDLFTFLDQQIEKGISQVLCTDISKDGMLGGVAVDLYEKIMQQYPNLYLIASGGIGCIDDLYRLEEKGIPAVVIGKALYERKITWNELKKFIYQ